MASTAAAVSAMVVAQAAPASPMLKPNMSSGSSTMFNMMPEPSTMPASVLRPCANKNGANPPDTMQRALPGVEIRK